MPNSFRFRSSCLTVLACAFAAAWTLFGCAQRPERGALARAGTQTITEQEFRERLEGMPEELRDVAWRNRKEFLETLVDERFLLEEARRRRLDRLDDVDRLLDEARKKILIAKLVELEVDQQVRLSQEDVQRYYDDHPDEFYTPLKLRAAHILVKDRQTAESLRSQLEAGASFEELARLHSIDRTASRGGDLGFFQQGQFIPEFEEVAFGLEPGQLSPVFETQFGFHVVRLAERLEPKLREFSTVRRLIEERLSREKRSKLYRDLIARLKGKTPVTLDEEKLEKLSPTGEGGAGS